MRNATKGRWYEILIGLGVPDNYLNGKNGPCPMCGGKDRFRWTNWEEAGLYICNQCGTGNGFRLLKEYKQIEFPEVFKQVEDFIGFKSEYRAINREKQDKETKEKHRREKAIAEVVNGSKEVTMYDSVGSYLIGRGLEVIPETLLINPKLYESETRTEMTAMVAKVVTKDGVLSSLHRTYIQNGKKAMIDSPRKIMSPMRPINGCAIRLFPIAQHIGIAEGIETAIAAHEVFNIPVWSVMYANGMKSFDPPSGVKQISVFADNDKNFTGQKAAYELANRMAIKGKDIEVYIPDVPGDDWLDHYNKLQSKYEND